MKHIRERTQSLYWRQLFVTAGMVLLFGWFSWFCWFFICCDYVGYFRS